MLCQKSGPDPDVFLSIVKRKDLTLKLSSFEGLLSDVYRQEWVVNSKASFKTAETVIDYLGSYTHRVGLSNDRL